MAKFIVEYNIHVGDKVSFIIHHVDHDEVQMGTVQDISQIPDVFVEGFRNSDHQYTRWKKDIRNLHFHYSICEEYGPSFKIEFEKKEPLEFVHKGDVDTKEFYDIEYIKYAE